jgi:hypothetical protein
MRAVQVFEGGGPAPVAERQVWSVLNFMTDKNGIWLYRVGAEGCRNERALAELARKVKIYDLKISVIIYDRDRHVTAHDDMRVTEVRRIDCGEGWINYFIAWSEV